MDSKNIDLKNVELPEHFFPNLMPFSCFNSKNACFGSFSFDSYSANDK
jgi:hypothetical protein